MAEQTVHGGYDVNELLERETGGPILNAVTLAELGSAVYAASETFAYDEGEAAEELRAHLAPLQRTLERLSFTKAGDLTLWRECRRCGGDGQTRGEDPCIECGGRGAIHADGVEA